MSVDSKQKALLIEYFALMLGVAFGGVLGPIVFRRIPMAGPLRSVLGAVLGAVCGYLVTTLIVAPGRKRRDAELTKAASSARAEARLPETIRINVYRGQLTLEGDVVDESDRGRADQILRSVPGIKGIVNHIRLLSPTGQADADQVRKRIQETLVHAAALVGGDISVRVDRSRVILEGKVRSWVASSEAERIAREVPGVIEVDNRLEVA